MSSEFRVPSSELFRDGLLPGPGYRVGVSSNELETRNSELGTSLPLHLFTGTFAP
jgi:hypothetical protein